MFGKVMVFSGCFLGCSRFLSFCREQSIALVLGTFWGKLYKYIVLYILRICCSWAAQADLKHVVIGL